MSKCLDIGCGLSAYLSITAYCLVKSSVIYALSVKWVINGHSMWFHVKYLYIFVCLITSTHLVLCWVICLLVFHIEGRTEKEPPSTLLWTLFFLAQVGNHQFSSPHGPWSFLLLFLHKYLVLSLHLSNFGFIDAALWQKRTIWCLSFKNWRGYTAHANCNWFILCQGLFLSLIFKFFALASSAGFFF